MLGEIQARRAYFMRALDEVDENGFISQKHPVVSAGENQWLALDQLMAAREEQLANLTELDVSRYYQPLGARAIWLLPLGFLIGLAANYLGSSTRVDLFANPLVGLVLWNVAVFALLVVRFFLGRKGSLAPPHELYGWFVRVLGPGQDRDDWGQLFGRARARACLRWYREQMPLAVARLSYWLHLVAAAIVLGALCGLYVRGLAKAYTFTWDSTFIENKSVFLQWVFGLPLKLAGMDLPALTGRNGAAWIHLLAIATLVYVVLPRLLLALWWAIRAKAMARAVDVGIAGRYFQKLLSTKAGLEPHVQLIGYGYKWTEQRTARLMGHVREIWGNRVRQGSTLNLAWGESSLNLVPQPGVKEVFVVCFSGAQTPEEEVHLAFAIALKKAMKQFSDHLFLVVIDAERVDEATAPRRKRAWREILAAAGIDNPCWVDLSDAQAGHVLADALGQGDA